MDRQPNFNRKPINSPDRHYQTTGEAVVSLPSHAEHAKEWFNPRLHEIVRSNGTTGLHWYAKIAPSAMVAHVDSKGRVAMVTNMERYPSGRASREFPGGAINPDIIDILDTLSPDDQLEVFRDTAIREASEEIALLIAEKDMRPLFKGPLQGSISVLDHQCMLFEATGGTPADLHHDDGEEGLLTFSRFSLEDAQDMIGYEITEPFTTASVLKLNELYGTRIKRLRTKITRLAIGDALFRSAV